MHDDLDLPDLSDDCPLELEDRNFIEGLGELPAAWMEAARPEEVLCDWHRKENQLQMGSCQGTELSSVLERLWFAITGQIVQLSKIFGYLGSQWLGRRLGADNGSRLTDGAQLALKYGIAPEALTGYPATYPAKAERDRILSPANFAAALQYRAKTAITLKANADEAYNVIGGGGGISFKVLWYRGMIPRDRIVRDFNPPAGTTSQHAMCVLGYRKSGILLPINSHNDGQYEITPEAYEKMLRHPQTAAIGFLPGEQPIDWYGDSYMLGKG